MKIHSILIQFHFLQSVHFIYLIAQLFLPFSRIKNQSSDANYPLTYNKNLFGFGADVALKIIDEIKIYLGISSFDQYYTEWEQMIIEEIGVQAEYKIVSAKLKFFNVNNRYHPNHLSDD
ncbi:MAG: hypothetical protein IPH11_09820 [Ignavibacteriales bacterium]|nr:hypothetical protein [Ignavibacteriales bacterium]